MRRSVIAWSVSALAGCSAVLGFDHGHPLEEDPSNLPGHGDAAAEGGGAGDDASGDDGGVDPDALATCTGVCTVVSGLPGPGAIAVDATYVYWAQDDGTIWRARQDAAEPKKQLASGHPA